MQRYGWDLAAAAYEPRFERMDAERLELPDHSFDVALCVLGLMYVPRPERARHLESIARWRRGRRFSIPAQFVIVGAAVER